MRFFACFLCLLCFSIALVQSQDTPIFPTIDPNSVSFVDVAMQIDHLAISNDADYLYVCDKGRYIESRYINECLLRSKTGDVLLETKSEFKSGASWSYNNEVIAISNPSEEGGDKFVFQTKQETIELVWDNYFTSGLWSPIQPSEMYLLLQTVYDWKTFQSDLTMDISPELLFDESKLRRSLGYIDLLWDVDTELPLGFIQISRKTTESSIEQSKLIVCYHPDEGPSGYNYCTLLLDTFDYSEMDVLGAQANGHWVLWYGNLGINPRSVIESPEQITDTVLYMTYLPTGQTQEVFRLSQLGQAHLELNTLAWSPDAQTLALSVRTNPFGLDIDPNTTPLVDDKPGVLILDLDWSGN